MVTRISAESHATYSPIWTRRPLLGHRRSLRQFLALLLLACAALLQGAPAALAANALIGHASPYLAMHGNDPVDWRDWGPEALAEARALDRPLFVSSGYFACHWCHVMQRESYQDPEIAALINAHFIPVKLDRELHPALDNYLIGFAERARGQAGWPLNVLLTPAGHPFFATTYLPPGQFRALMERTAQIWSRRGAQIAELAREAARENVARQAPETVSDAPLPPPGEIAAALRNRAMAYADRLSGGFGLQSRFPMAPQLAALLCVQQRDPSEELAAFLRLTLDRMADQGLHDALSGGFFRYTVDPDWQTPHFEKMLYTQALLAPLYLQAASVLGTPGYRALARETIDFMLDAMTGPGGGLIAGLSAVDAAGVEGGYYLWRAEELAQRLEPDQRAVVALVWGLAGPPQLDAGTLPRSRLTPMSAALRHALDPIRTAADLSAARQRLLGARAGRQLPRDTKQLAGWNGLALSALAAGARAFDDAGYRAAAEQVRDFLVGSLWDGERLHRARGASGWQGEATLEDYAYVARGLRDWAQLSDSAADRALAQELARRAWALFRRHGLWRDGTAVLLPDVPGEVILSDAPLPAADAVLLGLLTTAPDPRWREPAIQALHSIAGRVLSDPFNAATMAELLMNCDPIRPISYPSGQKPLK